MRDQRNQGFTDEQIIAALAAQQYPQSLIDSALKSASSPSTADSVLLSQYVNSYLTQGYTADQIRSSLIQQGYAPADVDRAFNVQETPAERKHHSFGLLLFPLLALFILVGGFFFITGESDAPAPLPIQPTSDITLDSIIGNLLPTAQRNPTAALAMCETVILSDQSRCILAVSRESANPNLCEDIEVIRLADTCYLEFVYDGHLKYCEFIQLPANIEYCETAKMFT